MAPGSYYVHLIVFITFSFHKSKAFQPVKCRSLPIITQNIYIITFLKNIAPFPPSSKKKTQWTTNWLSISKTCRSCNKILESEHIFWYHRFRTLQVQGINDMQCVWKKWSGSEITDEQTAMPTVTSGKWASCSQAWSECALSRMWIVGIRLIERASARSLHKCPLSQMWIVAYCSRASSKWPLSTMWEAGIPLAHSGSWTGFEWMSTVHKRMCISSSTCMLWKIRLL